MNSDGQFRLAIFIMVMFVVALAASAQSPTPGKDPVVPQATPTPDEDIKISTSLVDIPVSVFDKDKRFIPNLTRDDFQIFENGVQQKVEYFADTEQPFTVVLLLDLSGSMASHINEVKKACLAFMDRLKPEDRIAVITFGDTIQVLNKSMSDRDELRQAIMKLGAPQSGTLLYPAVEAVSQRIMSRINGRKALILFTDGMDNTWRVAGSSPKSTYRTSAEEAVRSSSLVFCVEYNPGTQTVTPELQTLMDVGDSYLRDLARLTGGRVFYEHISTALQYVAEELRHRYSIGYYPDKPAKANEARKLDVKVKPPGAIINARQYYIGR